MNTLTRSKNNIITFPKKAKNTKIKKLEKNFEIPKGSIEYFTNKGLDLFRLTSCPVDIHILVDNPIEIVRIDSHQLMLSGYPNIRKLITSPSKSENEIQGRKKILDTINNLYIPLREKLYKSKNEILYLNQFDKKFDHFEDLAGIIKELEKIDKLNLNNDYSLLANMIFAFDDLPANKLKNIRDIIPGHIQLIRNIGGNFFTKVADELSELFEKANNFSLKDLKKIYKERDHEAFGKLKTDIENFCKAYSHWDGILIAAYWARNGYIENATNIENDNEQAFSIKDARPLLNNDYNKYDIHVPNELPRENNIELYCGGNGSGKSTWLKSRLMLQLFYQTYGKVTSKNTKLMIRDQIIFVNRGGSGYGEDLSAFGNDIKRKLMPFINNLQNNALIFLDEFGSTIPENEAYCLIRALVDYLKKSNCKVYIASHNEKYINYVSKNKKSGVSLYNFKAKEKKDGTMAFTYKIRKGKDNAHTLKVFRNVGLPNDIISNATKGMLGSIDYNNENNIVAYKKTISYSPEEREQLKKENKGFAGFSRYNDMVKSYYGENKEYCDIVRKYKPLGYKNRPNKYYKDEDLFFLASHPNHMDQEAPPISFDFLRYGNDPESRDPISMARALESKNIHKKNIFTQSNGTLASLTTWGLTSDTKELQERQKFFKEIGQWSYKDANQIYEDINTFTWIVNNFQNGGGLMGARLDFDYNDLSKFNKVYWEQFIKNIEQYIVWEGFGRICEWFFVLIEMEDAFDNLPKGFRETHKEFLGKIQETINLSKRYNRANKRYREKWGKEFKTSRKLAEKICIRIEETISNLWDSETKYVIKKIKKLYEEIDEVNKPIDILTLETTKRNEIIRFLDNSRIFKNATDEYSETIANGFQGMRQVISALKGNGNLLEPLLEKLRSFDSIHTHQIANYLEDFIKLPKVEDFLELVRLRRDDPEGYRNSDKRLSINRDHGGVVILELLGLIDIANQIKKLGWTKVIYNDSGEINIKSMYHPGVEKKQKNQINNDFYLGNEQSFEILEGATMGGKTFHIQSVHWIIRLAHSIGYVPAKYTSIPCFDGIVYIDRILENEKKQLSAGQNDAKTWSEIILKIRNLMKEKGKKGGYWFSIDEIISSVPARFQKGLALAILEELTSFGQRGQISIHNPNLVSKLIKSNPKAYNVRHPEVKSDNKGNFDYTYKMESGRSIDKNGNFTAYSIETAEKMGLPKEITDIAKKYRKNLEKGGNINSFV